MKNYYTLSIVLLFLFFLSCSSDDDNSTSQDEVMEEMPDEINNIAMTSIPDPVFEQYLIDNNLDTEIDGEVITSNLTIVTNLILDNLDITDLTGIADFPNLDNLWLQNTNLTTLDVSENTLLKFLYFDNNQVSTIDVSVLPLLEKLSFIDNNVQEIIVGSNPNLQILDIKGNPINSLDVSVNNDLFTLETTGTNLDCIQVNEGQLSNIPTNWVKDESTNYSLDCD
jgi:hypothetical protein